MVWLFGWSWVEPGAGLDGCGESLPTQYILWFYATRADSSINADSNSPFLLQLLIDHMGDNPTEDITISFSSLPSFFDMFNLNFQVLCLNFQPFDCICCSSLLSFQHNDMLLTAVSIKLITILLLQQCTDLLPTHCKTRVSPRHVQIPVQSTALETPSPYLSTFLISRLLIRWRLFWIFSCWRH